MKLKHTFRSLVATSLLAIGSEVAAATVDIVSGVNVTPAPTRSFKNDVFKVYTNGDSIKVSADGSTSATVSTALANALSTAGINGLNGLSGTDTVEYGVLGFQAKGSNYFAIIKVSGFLDTTPRKILEASDQLGLETAGNAKSLFNQGGESLKFEVASILKDDGTAITDDITTVAKFTKADLGNFSTGTASDKSEIYVNSNVDAITSPDYTITTKNSQAFSPAVNTFKVRASADEGISHSFRGFTLQIETDNIGAPSGDTEITGYDAITAPDAGFINDANFADKDAVIAALPTTATITGTSDTVPLTWADTDSYNNAIAASYTFTATIGALPAGYVDDVNTISTIEVEVVEASVTEITGYDAITAPAGGSVTNPVFANAAAVTAALPATLTITGTSDTVPVTGWADTDTYSNSTAGSYTFTGTVGTLPAGYEDEVSTISTVEVEVAVTATDFVDNDALEAKVTDAVIGKQTALTFDTLFGDITDATSASGVISVDLDGTVYEVTLKVTPTAVEANENPVLGFRVQSGVDHFIGVKTTSDNSTDIKCLASGNVATLTEGLTLAVTKIHNKTAGEDVTDNSVAFNFKKLDYGKAASTEGHSYTTDKDSTPVAVSGGSVDFSSGFTALPESSVVMVTTPNSDNGGNTSFDLSGVTFDLFEQTPTPAIGVDVKQTGTLVEWTVEQELDVKEYQLVNVETGDVVATVVAEGSKGYSVTLAEGVVIELVVVDANGEKQSFTPADGNIVNTDYNLTAGWNLIATTGDNADLSEVEAATVGTMWAWDGSKYVASDAQDAFTGVWVYATEAASVSATAIKAGSTLTLQPGWSLAGPANNVNRSEDVVVFSWTSKYNEVLDTYNALMKGQAYWFFVTEETEIDVDVK